MNKCTEKEKIDVLQKIKEMEASGKSAKDYSIEESYLAMLPIVGFNKDKARFIVNRSFGILPDHEMDQNGQEIVHIY